MIISLAQHALGMGRYRLHVFEPGLAIESHNYDQRAKWSTEQYTYDFLLLEFTEDNRLLEYLWQLGCIGDFVE